MRSKWTRREAAEVANRYKSLPVFRAEQSSLYAVIRQRKWYDLVDGMKRSDNRKNIKRYSKEELQAVASQYTRMMDFRRDHPILRSVIHRYGLTEELTGHMERNPKGIYPVWTDEKLQTEALKYDRRIDFLKKSPTAYSSASNTGP